MDADAKEAAEVGATTIIITPITEAADAVVGVIKLNFSTQVNTFGQLFRLTTFGESHGETIGGVVDGMPSGIDIDTAFLQKELNRRRPGRSAVVSKRCEADELRLLSGVFEGKSTGAPIAFMVENTDHRSPDYEPLRNIYRPSHADFVYEKKYGLRDYRGGGRASARIMISRVVAGALAKLVLTAQNITVNAYTSQIGTVCLDSDYRKYDIAKAEQNELNCPDATAAEQMKKLLEGVYTEGDSVGGIVTCVVKGCPIGLGEPEFGKLHARLAAAIMSINACRGFEIGDGWQSASNRGSVMNDCFAMAKANGNSTITTLSNHSGGIQGGISNGQDIFFRAAFKPIPTIMSEQTTVDAEGKTVAFKAGGRHDVCAVVRAVPIVESMTAMTILDNLLINKAYNR